MPTTPTRKPGRPSSLCAETQSRIRAALRFGFGQSETARMFGVTRDQVTYLARKHGIASRANRCPTCGRIIR